jgi:phosphoglycolate phosphatase
MLRQSVSFTLHRVNAIGLASDPETLFSFKGKDGAIKEDWLVAKRTAGPFTSVPRQAGTGGMTNRLSEKAWAVCDTDHMRSVIFDLDGTLTDSKPGILGCLINALEAHRIAWTPPLDWFIGPPADQSLRRLMPDADEARRAALLHDYRLCYDATGWAENSVYPGVHEVLQRLQEWGWQLFVCTSKRDDFALRVLDKFDLSRYFRAVYADTAGSLHHTKTALLRRLLEEQSLNPATTFMVGDRNFDVEAARTNGVTSIAVTYGYGTSEELASARPDHTCKKVDDLLPLFSALAPEA